MNRTTFCFSALAIVSLASLSAQAGLVAYWPMDEGSGSTTANVAGGGLAGTLTNVGANTWVTGRDGTGFALNFNGSNQRMNAGTNAALDAINEKLTAGTWVKTGLAGAWYRAIASKFGDTSINNFWGLGWMATNQLGFVIRDNSSPRHEALPRAPSGWGLDNQWHHVMGVRDKGGTNKVSFYGDGDLLQELNDGVDSISNTRPFQLATHGGGNYVAQTVDDLAIWDQPLTPYQVRALARGQVTPATVGSATNDILRDNPVAYWRFEESRSVSGANLAADSTGNGHTATFNGPVVTVPRHTEFDPLSRAAKFDLTNDFVTSSGLTPAEFGGNGSYSVEFWFKADTRHQGDLFALQGAAAGGHMLLLETQSNGTLRFLHRNTPSSGGGFDLQVANAYLADEWYHLAAINDAGTMLLYLDGNLIGTRAGTSAWTDDMNMLMGRLNTGDSSRSFQGLIDEVALFDYALSAEQIRTHMNMTVPEPASALLVLLGTAAAGGRIRRRTRR